MTNKLKPSFIFILLVTKKCQCYEDIYFLLKQSYIPNCARSPQENENYPHLKDKIFHKDLFHYYLRPSVIVFGFIQAISKRSPL